MRNDKLEDVALYTGIIFAFVVASFSSIALSIWLSIYVDPISDRYFEMFTNWLMAGLK
jgi:hypothetical protein